MKRIGFLSFGHWSESPYSQVRSGSDALIQSIELAVAAEELGADGAYFRVHHFAHQLASPFPLLAAVGARTSRIEAGTAVIDMRYENPFYMVEDAGAADLIAGGRLQLGISRGSPEQVIDGYRHFGYQPAEGETDADMARRHAQVFLELLRGEGFAQPNPRPMFPNPPGLLRIEPHSPGLRERIWWGAATTATAVWAAELGMNLQSSTLVFDESGEPLHVQQRKQIEAYREAWAAADHDREPRVSVSRSIFAIVDDRDRAYFGGAQQEHDQIGYIDENTKAIFGRSYAAEPEDLVRELAEDTAIAAADTLLLTVPNQLGVDYNAHAIESLLKYVAPELGWRGGVPRGPSRHTRRHVAATRTAPAGRTERDQLGACRHLVRRLGRRARLCLPPRARHPGAPRPPPATARRGDSRRRWRAGGPGALPRRDRCHGHGDRRIGAADLGSQAAARPASGRALRCGRRPPASLVVGA